LSKSAKLRGISQLHGPEIASIFDVSPFDKKEDHWLGCSKWTVLSKCFEVTLLTARDKTPVTARAFQMLLLNMRSLFELNDMAAMRAFSRD
jgi:hypothetical protein